MKSFKTNTQLITHLKERKMLITDEKSAIVDLEREGYYRIINGYRKPFMIREKDKKEYIANVKFEEITSLYHFDVELLYVLFRYLMIVETRAKAAISYVFSKNHSCHGYRDPSNFDPLALIVIKEDNQANDIDKVTRFEKMILEFDGAINRCVTKKDKMERKKCSQKKNRNPNSILVWHFIDNHGGDIPLWALIRILTFGNTSSLYKNLKIEDRNEVAQYLRIGSSNDLRQCLWLLSILRNACAHGDRIYSIKFENCRLRESRYHNLLGIKKNSANQCVEGIEDLFASIIALKQLLERSEFENMINAVISLIEILSEQLVSIDINKILTEMGFPNNWGEIKDF